MAETGARLAIREIAQFLQAEPALQACSAEEAPSVGGAYVLAIGIDAPVDVSFFGHRARLGPGTYVYAGSAFGPGGIRARLRRHFRRDKKLHWYDAPVRIVDIDDESIRRYGQWP
jgi:hypothetical protein